MNRRQKKKYKELRRRDASDPMLLLPYVKKEMDNYFLKRGLTYIFGQREKLLAAAKNILQAVPGTVTAVPFQPGLGKSTLLRVLLTVMAGEFQRSTPIAETIGGPL